MAKPIRLALAEPADRASAEVRAQAREAGPDAIRWLQDLAQNSGSDSVKLAAIKELLDGGFGRPAAAPTETAAGVVAHVLVHDGYGN